MSSQQSNKDKPRSSKCRHFCFPLMFIITALPVGNLARVMTPVSPLNLHVQFALLSQKNKCKKIAQRKQYIRKQKGNTVSSLSLKMPAKTVPPTPGTALQQKIETNLQKSLGNTLNLHLQQQMDLFQASMLEAFQSL